MKLHCIVTDSKRLTQRILISLSWIRATALLMQVLYIFWFVRPIKEVVWVLIVIQLCILLSAWINQKRQMSDTALLVHLCLDLLLLASYIYVTGGVTNPLISLFLLPMVTGAVALQKKAAIMLLISAVGLYSLLYFVQPAAHQHHSFSNHLTGMWIVFIASAGLLYYVVSYLSDAIKQQQERIKEHQQRQLRDDYLMALGLSSADAAHQLNTPLATLSLLAESGQERGTLSDDDLILIVQQIKRCQSITQNIQRQFEQLKAEEFATVEISDLLEQIATGFRLLRPDSSLDIKAANTVKGRVRSHLGLHSAILNLMDNAANASMQTGSAKLQIRVLRNTSFYILQIYDLGPGLPADILQGYGWRPSQSHIDHEDGIKGMGVGTLISNASIEFVGGHLEVKNTEKGALVSIYLPIEPTQESGSD